MSENTDKGVAPKDCTLSNGIIHLYNSAGVNNVNDAVVVLCHGFMLESGFIPQDVPAKDKYQSMPENWNTKGVFKLKYAHFCCPSYTCYMTCVPLYSNMCAHGIICDVDCSETVGIKVNVNNYLKEKKDISSLYGTFLNIEELSRHFKDDFCLPLLNLLHETTGNNHLFGLRGLVDELKMYILQLLPVECVVSMSAVNKDFNHLANSSYLWKYLYQRDFARDGVPDIDTASSSNNNWKEMYIKKYRKRTRKADGRLIMMPHFRLPPIFAIGPDYDTDLDIHFNPPPPEFFPPPQNIFPLLPRYPFYRL